ncbi:hypothetical protein DY000_02058439 [Brassica cretica]|uniref:Uncharacterized protein n=1 Tax=Brassica cretica TaxID=69181 RepID=A0ABQ7B2J2_BRACR|nr:hypothetical protein DY000_02058439 [Brassica cretica]
MSLGSFHHYLKQVRVRELRRVFVRNLFFHRSSNRRPGVRHSTFESLRLGHSSQSIASGFLCFWDFMNFKKDMKPSLKADSIAKVDRFEVARFSNMYKITDHPFLIRFISLTIIDEVIKYAHEINLQSRLDCSTISK